jgi:hypothetical protein
LFAGFFFSSIGLLLFVVVVVVLGVVIFEESLGFEFVFLVIFLSGENEEL